MIRCWVSLNLERGRDEFLAQVRRAEELGYYGVACADHLGAIAPFSGLVAAAGVSSRLAFRTYVLNAPFWNPALLAREVETANEFCGGRLELGLGSGHMKKEFEDAGIPWEPLAQRTVRLETLLGDLRARLGGAVPFLIGAMSESGLQLAAAQADIVGFSGLRQIAGGFTLFSRQETEKRIALVRSSAGERDYRADVLMQLVSIGDRSVMEPFFGVPGVDEKFLEESLFGLVAENAADAAQEVRLRGEKFGLTDFTVHGRWLESFGAVVRELAS